MANPDLKVAQEYPEAAPVVARVFKRICPSLELEDFNAVRNDGWRYTADYHWINFSGTESELLHLGLIEASMIPVKPKRLNDFAHGWIRRIARGRLSVHFILAESLPRAHPLAPLASWNWPIVDTPCAWLRLVVDNSKLVATATQPQPPNLRLVVNNMHPAKPQDCAVLSEMIQRMGQISPKETRALGILRKRLQDDGPGDYSTAKFIRRHLNCPTITPEMIKGMLLGLTRMTD